MNETITSGSVTVTRPVRAHLLLATAGYLLVDLILLTVLGWCWGWW